ncbi:MAG: hypothetical protein GF309_12865 [Candidatus Lokiarchaeota archaeon]|nr:hypothetical protein [Candidatus Lokiarchaeota archaeon]
MSNYELGWNLEMLNSTSQEIRMSFDSAESRFVMIVAVLLFIFLSCNSVPVEGSETPAYARGEKITIECYLLQNGTYGDPVSNQEVEFFDQTYDTYIGSSITDENGFASVEWQIPIIHPLGETTLNITFRGNETLALSPSVQWTVITILSSTTITPTIHNNSLHPFDTLNMSVRLTDDTGFPLNSQLIRLLSGGQTIQSTFTGENGSFELFLECNLSWANLGYNTINIMYGGNSTEYLQPSHSSVGFTLEKKATKIFISDNTTLYSRLNDSHRFSVTLSSGEESVRNASIEIRINNEYYDTQFTTTYGTAFVDVHFNESFSVGNHTMSIHYHGSERYEASDSFRTIILSSPCFVDFDEKETLTVNSPNIITMELRDAFNRPIPRANVTITDTISRENASGIRQENGIYSFTIFFTKQLGSRDLLLHIYDMPYLLNHTYSFQVYVWSQPEFEFLYCSTMGYAAPGQTISFLVSLTDSYGPIFYSEVQILMNNNEYGAVHSDGNGQISGSITIPEKEGYHSIALHYGGNKSGFILNRTRIFQINVSHSIPVVPWSISSRFIPMEKRISVKMMLLALNGSMIEGLQTTYKWLNQSYRTRTSKSGLLDLSLGIPNHPGTYTLEYHIESTQGIKDYDGFLEIEVTGFDISKSNGFGLLPFTLSIAFSFSLVLLPPLRKRYLLG